MVRTTSRLTAMKVSQTKKPGMYADGGGLYLRVAKEGTKHWVYRFMLNGRPRWMGLGPLALFSLQEARGKALRWAPASLRRCRSHRSAASRPGKGANRSRASHHVQAMRGGFHQGAPRRLAERQTWAQWEATLATYAESIIGALPVQSIDTSLVMKVLEREGPE